MGILDGIIKTHWGTHAAAHRVNIEIELNDIDVELNDIDVGLTIDIELDNIDIVLDNIDVELNVDIELDVEHKCDTYVLMQFYNQRAECPKICINYLHQ